MRNQSLYRLRYPSYCHRRARLQTLKLLLVKSSDHTDVSLLRSEIQNLKVKFGFTSRSCTQVYDVRTIRKNN
jgi:hypothetical protein